MLGHIVRCEGRKTMGWQVRIPTGQPRKYTSKLFSDSTFGGKKKALAAAETYLAANALPDDARPGYLLARAFSAPAMTKAYGIGPHRLLMDLPKPTSKFFGKASTARKKRKCWQQPTAGPGRKRLMPLRQTGFLPESTRFRQRGSHNTTCQPTAGRISSVTPYPSGVAVTYVTGRKQACWNR